MVAVSRINFQVLDQLTNIRACQSLRANSIYSRTDNLKSNNNTLSKLSSSTYQHYRRYHNNNNNILTSRTNTVTGALSFGNRRTIMSTTESKQQNNTSRLVPADRIKNEQESVWVEFIKLALEENPLNLGQGSPDYATAFPDHITAGLAKAATGSNFMLNQYTRGFGHPRLVRAISTLYSRLLNRNIDANKEVLVTIGAYESIYCIINAFIGPEDEAIIIEPYFDCYEPMVRLARGKCTYVPLRLKNNNQSITTSADWLLDEDELESKITNKTKMLILNTPHNPLGKVFSRKELEGLARICKKHDLLVLSDEVYEHLVLDGEHIRIASLDDMWQRTITVGSAGKTFSVTGWKLGWCYGPEALMKYVQLLHQDCIYTCPTPIQEAVAESFEIETERMGTPQSYWTSLVESLKQKRDRMAQILRDANMEPTVPEGGYFLLANTSNISKNYDFSQEQGLTKDHKFVRWLSKNKKLQGIPPSAFYSPEHKKLAEDFIRLCYFKSDSTLAASEELISKLVK